MKKKLLILFISVFAFMSTSNALTVSPGGTYSNADDADNTVRMKVLYTPAETGEVITQMSFKCTVFDDAAATAYSSLSCAFDGGSDTYKYPAQPANLVGGKEYTADIIVTNPTTTKRTVYVKVEAEVAEGSIKGTKKEFVQSVADVKAKKEETPASNISTLSSLKFSKGKISPAFNKDVQEYTVYDITDTINSITYDYTCSDKNCTIADVSGGTSVSGNKITLAKGENKIYITSKSADGTSTTKYTFTIFRGETSYNSAKLKVLEIKDATLSPAFNKDTTTYEVTLPTSTTSIKDILNYEAVDSNAKIETKGLDKLKEGKNVAEISVTNVTEEETITYTINITLEDAKAIKVVGYKDGKVTYIVEGSEDEIIIAEEEFAKKYPEEEAKIKNGTYVFDKDGKRVEKQIDNKETTIGEDTKTTKKSSKVWIIVLLIVLGLGIIGASAYFIFFKKPKDASKDDKNKKDKGKKQDAEKAEEKEEVKEDSKEDEKEEVEEESEEDKTEKKKIVEDDDDEVQLRRSKTKTVDIDEALSDLMNTKEYDFKTKTSIKKDEE